MIVSYFSYGKEVRGLVFLIESSAVHEEPSNN
jgi:hypothetical protein